MLQPPCSRQFNWITLNLHISSCIFTTNFKFVLNSWNRTLVAWLHISQFIMQNETIRNSHSTVSISTLICTQISSCYKTLRCKCLIYLLYNPFSETKHSKSKRQLKHLLFIKLLQLIIDLRTHCIQNSLIHFQHRIGG